MKNSFYLIFACHLMIWNTYAQSISIQERLGYPADTKLLIIHADDIGVSHSENMATIYAMENGSVNSGSIMVPCPWFGEIVTYSKQNPKWDFGLHLTLTAEWENYKWDGVLPQNEIPTLLNPDGYFYASVEDVVKHAKAAEVEAEIRAQVQRALDMGIDVTHLDTHMRALFSHPDFFGPDFVWGEQWF